MFVVAKIEDGAKVIAEWFGFSPTDKDEGLSFIDIFNQFVIEISLQHLQAKTVSVSVGSKKSELTNISPTSKASEAVSCLGHFVRYQLTSPDVNNNYT